MTPTRLRCAWRTTTGRRVCLMGTLRHDCELRARVAELHPLRRLLVALGRWV